MAKYINHPERFLALDFMLCEEFGQVMLFRPFRLRTLGVRFPASHRFIGFLSQFDVQLIDLPACMRNSESWVNISRLRFT